MVEDAFADSKGPSLKNTPKGTPLGSKTGTPLASKAGTPAGSGAEDAAAKDGDPPKIKKKKLTRNQMKVQEERRRKRKLDWLTFGGPKPEDTDSD